MPARRLLTSPFDKRIAEVMIRRVIMMISSQTILAAHVDKQYKLHQKSFFRLWEAARERMDGTGALAPSFRLPRGSAKRLIPIMAQELGAKLIVMGTGCPYRYLGPFHRQYRRGGS